jgi:hypothetical protein
LQRNLVYTGLTRGKQLVVLVGQKKALAMAIKNHLGRRRYTKLAEWLVPAAIPPDRGAVTGPAAPLNGGARSRDGL